MTNAKSTPKAAKITLSEAVAIPFEKLALSQANVRRIAHGQSIEDLAEDIAHRGLLQSLSVRPILDEAGAETGRYEVPAGEPFWVDYLSDTGDGFSAMATVATLLGDTGVTVDGQALGGLHPGHIHGPGVAGVLTHRHEERAQGEDDADDDDEGGQGDRQGTGDPGGQRPPAT